MRWIATLSLFLILAGSALAAGSDEQYLDIYNEILQADALQQSGQQEAAALRYLQAQTDLQKLQTDHASWNPDIVKFRLDYLADKLQALAKFLPNTNGPATTAPVTAPTAPQAAPSDQPNVADLQQQNAGYQEQIRSLSAVNSELEGKLKEALSVQPASVSQTEYAKAEAKITALQKERDLLAVALDQEKANTSNAVSEAKAAAVSDEIAALKAHADEDAKKAQAELAAAKEAAAASESKLADATKELDALKAAREADAQANAAVKARADEDEKKAQEEVARLRDASAESDKVMAAATKELELLREARPIVAATPAAGDTAKQIPEERDQLKQAMAEISTDETEIARLKDALGEAEKKWNDASNELVTLKSAPPATASPAATTPPADTTAGDTNAIVMERDKLKQELAERSKELAEIEAHHNEELVNIRTSLRDAEQRRDELEKQLAATATAQPAQPVASSPTAPAAQPAPVQDAAAAEKLEKLQARIAVLEADPVPYTSEELAILKLTPPPVSTEPAKPPVESHPLHSIKDLPAGAGTLWTDALRATMEHNYDVAEKKFNEVLRQDPTNVYVLAYLANAQFAANHLAECEQSVLRALAIEPNDPGSLYLLGVLRYRQNRLDDAFDALSRSAEYNPTNSATQNFLGCVLADKGLRPAAETALRKALQTDPDYAEAHFNLAVVYVGNQPPSMELARWHYKKAIALGHAKSEMLEKLLSETPGASNRAAAPATPPGAVSQ